MPSPPLSPNECFARRRPFTEAAQTVVLGDGAPWICKIAHELFPRSIQIVDRFHVKQHLSLVAKVLYGPTSKQAPLWAQRRHEELDCGRLSNLLRALDRHAGQSEEARKCSQYIRNNRDRIRYPQFQEQGLRSCGGRLQSRHGHKIEASRHALDYPWIQRNHRPPLF